MRHHDIDFDVKEDEPSKWRWTIYPKKESGGVVRNETFYETRDQAIIASMKAIDDGRERSADRQA